MATPEERRAKFRVIQGGGTGGTAPGPGPANPTEPEGPGSKYAARYAERMARTRQARQQGYNVDPRSPLNPRQFSAAQSEQLPGIDWSQF